HQIESVETLCPESRIVAGHILPQNKNAFNIKLKALKPCARNPASLRDTSFLKTKTLSTSN
ncbi:MAG: hypothetical protein ACK5DG_10100, partial [Chitinophagaceae bacterium]